MVSRRRRNTSLNSGGCVDIVSSGEEGAGAPSAIGQTSAVHGVAGSRVERARRGPRSRCLSVSGDELDTWLQDLPQRHRGRVRPAPGSTNGPRDQPTLPLPGGANRDRRPAPVWVELARDRRSTRPSAVDDSAGVAPQRRGWPRLSALRCPSACHRASSSSPSTPRRHQRPPQRRGHRVARPAMEPTAD